MQLDHDSACALEELALIVNDKDRDVLADPKVLDEFLDELGITGSRAGDDKELAAMRRLRKRLPEHLPVRRRRRQGERRRGRQLADR